MMKYSRLTATTVFGLLLISAAMALILFAKSRLLELGYEISPTLFIAIAFGVLGIAFSLAAKLCLKEIERLKDLQSRSTKAE